MHARTQVCNTPNELPFLHILQSLLVIERDSELGVAIWAVLEELMQQAVIMNSPGQAEKTLQVRALAVCV